MGWVRRDVVGDRLTGTGPEEIAASLGQVPARGVARVGQATILPGKRALIALGSVLLLRTLYGVVLGMQQIV